MRPIFLIALFAAALAAAPLTDTTIALAGRVPFGVTDSFVMNNYARIWKDVAPDVPIDKNRINIIYYSRADQRKLGVRLPEWGGGGAIGSDTVIIPVDHAPLADMDLRRVTVHELVHISLDRAYGRLRLPRWFHEGLAMTLSGELLFEEQLTLSRAIFTKRLMPLDSVERVNRFDAYGADLAYSESHLAVAYLIDKYGLDGIPELLEATRTTGRFDQALLQVFGFTPEEFDRLVMTYIANRYRFMFLVGDSYLFWLPAAALVVVAFVLVRIRNKKKRKRMEEEEARELLEEAEEDKVNGDAWRVKEDREGEKQENGENKPYGEV